MCTKWSIQYAQIVTNMQQLLHLCIRDVNARTCLVTKEVEEKRTEERRTKEKEAKEKTMTKESLKRRDAWKS